MRHVHMANSWTSDGAGSMSKEAERPECECFLAAAEAPKGRSVWLSQVNRNAGDGAGSMRENKTLLWNYKASIFRRNET